MALRKTDSIYASVTGRKPNENVIDAVLRKLVEAGKIPSRQTDESQWIRECLYWLWIWNTKLPKPFDFYFMASQIWHETNGFISTYLVRDGNLAGIGIWKSGVPSPWIGKLSAEDAAKVYLYELIFHTYSLPEIEAFERSGVGEAFIGLNQRNTHLTKIRALRMAVHWPNVRTINDLRMPVPPYDYVWAEDQNYGDGIEEKAAFIFPDIPDSTGVTPMSVSIGNRPLRIAIGAGHANTSGGNDFERAINGKATNEVVKLARKSDGFEIRCYTPNDGLGFFNGPLDAAAATVTKWANEGWKADILHELHHEGTAPSVRGGFVIYPDSEGLIGRNPGNVDIDVREAAGMMAQLLVKPFGGVTRYGIPGRGMSEKETGVGEDNFRLGVFGAWSEPYFNANSFQFITEAAAYTNSLDLALMQKATFPASEAFGVLDAYSYIARTRGNWTYPYSIGGKPVDTGKLGPDGLPLAAGLDAGLLRMLFGELREGSKVYRFNSNGTISKAWYSHFKSAGKFPRLEFHFRDTNGREYFGFSDGSILWRPTAKDRFRWGLK